MNRLRKNGPTLRLLQNAPAPFQKRILDKALFELIRILDKASFELIRILDKASSELI